MEPDRLRPAVLPPVRRSPGLLLLLPLAFIVLALASVGRVAVQRDACRARATAPARTTARLVFESQPSGARVVGEDGEVLGVTPAVVYTSVSRYSPMMTFRLERDGYVEHPVTVRADRDTMITVGLAPVVP